MGSSFSILFLFYLGAAGHVSTSVTQGEAFVVKQKADPSRWLKAEPQKKTGEEEAGIPIILRARCPFKPFIQLTAARRPSGIPRRLCRNTMSVLKLVVVIAAPEGTWPG
jgi:hypothetical protein